MLHLHSEWDQAASYIKSQYQLNKDLNSFRGWDSISRIPLYEVHLYEEYLDYAKEIYNSLEDGILDIWKLAMTHSPQGYFSDTFTFDKHSINLFDIITNPYNIKNNHHYFKYQSLTGKNILEFDHIVELGGGCGDFAKFIFNMGYKNEYTIIDIHEIHPIQKFNLSGHKVNFTTSPIDYKPNTLFISTWGLSECPFSWRNEILNRLAPESYLITYQSFFEDISNETYFQDFEGIREDIPWIHWDGGSKYLLN